MNAQSSITWSKQLVEIAQVIGEAQVVQLCQAFGGTRVYVPRIFPAGHEVVEAIGAQAAKQLAEHYHGTNIDFPKAYSRRARAIEMVESGQMTQRAAARASDYSDRHLRRLLKGGDDEEQFKLL